MVACVYLMSINNFPGRCNYKSSILLLDVHFWSSLCHSVVTCQTVDNWSGCCCCLWSMASSWEQAVYCCSVKEDQGLGVSGEGSLQNIHMAGFPLQPEWGDPGEQVQSWAESRKLDVKMNLVHIFKENGFKLWHYFVFNFHFWCSCGLNLGPVLSHWTVPPTLSVTFLKWLHQLVCLYNRKSSFSGISVSPECDSWHTLGISARSGVSRDLCWARVALTPAWWADSVPWQLRLSPHESVYRAPTVDGFFLHPPSAALCSLCPPAVYWLRAAFHPPFHGHTGTHGSAKCYG